MRKLTVTEPETDTLVLCFDMTGKEGADRLAHAGAKKFKAARRLQQVFISPCSATELKASPSSNSCGHNAVLKRYSRGRAVVVDKTGTAEQGHMHKRMGCMAQGSLHEQ